MRFTLSQVLTGLLVVALTLALFLNQRRSQRQIDEFKAKAEARERLEDALERAVIKQLAPGISLDRDPYYRLLIDDIITSDDPDFTYCTELISKNTNDAPPSFDGCELHVFSFREGPGFESDYVVVARDNRCVLVFWAGGSMGPV